MTNGRSDPRGRVSYKSRGVIGTTSYAPGALALSLMRAEDFPSRSYEKQLDSDSPRHYRIVWRSKSFLPFRTFYAVKNGNMVSMLNADTHAQFAQFECDWFPTEEEFHEYISKLADIESVSEIFDSAYKVGAGEGLDTDLVMTQDAAESLLRHLEGKIQLLEIQ